MALVTAPALD